MSRTWSPAVIGWGVVAGTVGGLLTTCPSTVIDLTGGRRSPPAWLVRILGARYLIQGATVLIAPGRPVVIVATAVDATHAASMIAAACLWPAYRRPAGLSAAVATASAFTGGLLLRRRPR
jgi:hypothetical protein